MNTDCSLEQLDDEKKRISMLYKHFVNKTKKDKKSFAFKFA